jgi:hypothetical protein
MSCSDGHKTFATRPQDRTLRPTRLPIRHTHLVVQWILLRLPTISSSSPIPEQATPNFPRTTYQEHTQRATCKNPGGLCQTISQRLRGPNSSDFGHESCVRKKHTLHHHSPTCPSQSIIAAASPRDHTTQISYSEACPTVEHEGHATTMFVLPPSSLPQKCTLI